MAGAMTSPQTHLYEARLRSALCVYSMVVPIVRCESPIRFRQTPSVFHRVQNEPLTVVAMPRLQSRSFARKHDSAS